MSRDPISANHQQAGVIQQPTAQHSVTHAPQPAVILTSSTDPTQLPFQFPVAISSVPVPPPVIGPPINGLPNYASDFFPDFGSRSEYGRNRNPKDDGIHGKKKTFYFLNNYII